MSDSEKTKSAEIPKTRSVGILVIKDDKVLLVEHKEAAGHPTGMWGLPSGRPDFDEEEDVDVAIRELGQETGLVVTRDDLHVFPGSYYEAALPRKDGSIIDFTWQVFNVSNFTGDLRPSEETNPYWKTMEEMRELDRNGNLLPNTINAAEAGMRKNV